MDRRFLFSPLLNSLFLCLVFGVGICCAQNTGASNTTINWFDFSKWDHGAISTHGQTFDNVFGDVDLVVVGSGEFPSQSAHEGGVNGIVSRNGTQLEQKFHFKFSQPVELVARYSTAQEISDLNVFALDVEPQPATASFTEPRLLAGPLQQRVNLRNRIAFQGAFGGLFEIGTSDEFSIIYDPETAQDFRALGIGLMTSTPVPEPKCGTLLMLGLLTAIGSFRRRR